MSSTSAATVARRNSGPRDDESVVEQVASTHRSESSTEAIDDEEIEFPNTWAKIRYKIREPAAEFLGTMILIGEWSKDPIPAPTICTHNIITTVFGTAVDCQVVLSNNKLVASSQEGVSDCHTGTSRALDD